jgi:hypothetical protein
MLGPPSEGHKMAEIDKPRRVSRIDAFAPIDLKAFILRDTDLWALMAVVNAHEWKALKGDLKFDVIADMTGWSTDKIGRVVSRAVDQGLIRTRNTGHGYVIEKAVGPMTWDEYHELRKSEAAKRGRTSRETTTDNPQKAGSLPAESGRPNNKNDQNDRNDLNPPGMDGGTSPQGQQKKKKEDLNLDDLNRSEIGILFRDAHLRQIKLPYRFTSQDLAAYRTIPELGLSDQQIRVSIGAFFSPDSWHLKNHHVAFRQWVGQAQRYAQAAAPAAGGTAYDLAKYYEPWDPRHPNYRAGNPILDQQRKLWEAKRGPWKPKPDWKPEDR